MVKVAVREDDILDAEEVKPHLPGVGDEDIRVAGIKEDAGPAVLEIEREPWFREEVAVGEGDVIHEDRQPHARRSPRSATVAVTVSMQILGT